MTQAVILAGGLGTRLRPVLNNLPKPLAPILGKPFLEYQILTLRRHALTRLVICVSYQAEKIRDYFGDGSRWGLEIIYSVEPTPQGTAGALRYAEPLLQDEFLVLNGDTYVDLDYGQLVEWHQKTNAYATLALTRMTEPASYGNVSLDSNGRIFSFAEKMNGQDTAPSWVNAGVYILSRKAIHSIPRDRPASLEHETFPLLIKQGKPVYGLPVSGYFVDIGTPSNYARFEQDLKEGRIHVDS
ncbi:MAG: nucleotidyltransferase family protein [Anaerolineae bacterium]